MAELSSLRRFIDTADVRYRRALSEFLFTKFAQPLNLLMNRTLYWHTWKVNLDYPLAGFPILGDDGGFNIPWDCEICQVSMYNFGSGTSGSTTFDIRRFTSSNTPSGGSSIFSVKPTLNSSASDYSFLHRQYLPTEVDLQNPTGSTMPTLAVSQLNKGDMLTFNIDSSMTGASNAGITVYFRLR